MLDPKSLLDPKKLLNRLDQIRRDKPFRYLGRRVVQGMAEAAGANLLIGKRTAPGRYLVLRLVEDGSEKEDWERQFSEGRPTVLQELVREAGAREIELRSAAEVDLYVLTDAEQQAGEAERALSTAIPAEDIPSTLERLRAERELVIPRRLRTLLIESEPSEAQVYLDDRPIGVTPCRVEDLDTGTHAITLSRPGYLLHEGQVRLDPGAPGQRVTHRVTLAPEPPMASVEIKTFPPRALATISGETRETPARWRIPAGEVSVRLELEDFYSVAFTAEAPPGRENRPVVVQRRLEYVGPDREEVVGRLLVYRQRHALPTAPTRHATAASQNRISSFFSDADGAPDEIEDFDLGSWADAPQPLPGRDAKPDEDLLGERPLRRGIVLIGRPDPSGDLQPDVRLMDAENSVSRGCHAWVWVYADRSTGAAYNTFLVGNNSPGGIRVDGALVMETRRLSDASEIEIGNFRLRLVKVIPEARVEFGF